MNVIFDLDGTLADCAHRRHLVTKDRRDPQWRTFFNECGKDLPIDPIIEVFRAMLWQDHDVRIWSGRCNSVRNLTVGWLLDWVTAEAARFQHEPALKMRPVGNSWPDDELKEYWLRESIDIGWTPHLVFDDRQKVVDMWRRHGIVCVQVAPGDF